MGARVFLEPGSLSDRLYNDLMRDKYGRWSEHIDDPTLIEFCERAERIADEMSEEREESLTMYKERLSDCERTLHSLAELVAKVDTVIQEALR